MAALPAANAIAAGVVDPCATVIAPPAHVASPLADLRRRAADRRWTVDDLDWSDTAPASRAARLPSARPMFDLLRAVRRSRHPATRWRAAEWATFGQESLRWSISHVLHGEQGALMVAAKLVRSLPSWDHKASAASQVLDEARHVEVFTRYLEERVGEPLPPERGMVSLLADLAAAQDWDYACIGVQCVLETAAMHAFRDLADAAPDRLLEELLVLVRGDESRHLAFGAIALRDHLPQLGDAAYRRRQDFALEACNVILRGMRQQQPWLTMGLSARDAADAADMAWEARGARRQALVRGFGESLRRVGLLERNGGHVLDGLAALVDKRAGR